MILLGIDIGTSFIKVAAVDADTRQSIATASFPDFENEIYSERPGWAEQPPEMWWSHTVEAIKKLIATGTFKGDGIAAIGISYQMHGLVVVDKDQEVLRRSIIWCDSRAVETGEKAKLAIGEDTCSSCLLNSPGNFTASKLGWVKENEPEIYDRIDKFMLPGDFIAMKLTGKITTTPSALSEGILWDFSEDMISKEVMEYYQFADKLVPAVQPIFSNHGFLTKQVAGELGLRAGIPVTYKAGDQPNNALSLNVLKPGEVAANAGTSGVIYAVTDKMVSDEFSRINSFVHVNHEKHEKRLGVLLCINGAAIMNSWVRKIAGDETSYKKMNAQAASIKPGSDGLFVLPFGNGAERMLQNKLVNAHILHIDLNIHSKAHIFRAVQEGIAFAFRYGLDILRENGLRPAVIRAGKANLFLSEVFTSCFANATGVALELYENEGSVGAALGAGIGAGIFKNFEDVFSTQKILRKIVPDNPAEYDELYKQWKELLNIYLENSIKTS